MFDAYADRAGGFHEVTLRTGLTLADALGIAERQIAFIERTYQDDFSAASAPDFNQAQMLVRLAHGAWDRTLISIELADEVQKALVERPLILTRNPWAGQGPAMLAASKGVLTKLWSRASTQLAATVDSVEGEHVSPDVFDEIYKEGILDWAGAGGTAMTRKCAMNGRWYTPKVRNRGRFCSDECRKRFNSLRTLADELSRSFECACCHERQDLDVFSGLRTTGEEDAATLEMTQWSRNAPGFVCAACVVSAYPVWAPYVQGIGGGAERS